MLVACVDCHFDFYRHHAAVVRCRSCRSAYMRRQKRQSEKARLIRKHGKAYRVDAYQRRRAPIRAAWQADKARRGEVLADLIKRGRAERPDKPWLCQSFTQGEKVKVRASLDASFAMRRYLADAVRRRAPGRKVRDHVREMVVSGCNRARLSDLLGYTVDELRAHLERQFVKGMTWEAYRLGLWHIDHIQPLRLFILRKPEEMRAAWALSNLRPLWADENARKGGMRTHLI